MSHMSFSLCSKKVVLILLSFSLLIDCIFCGFVCFITEADSCLSYGERKVGKNCHQQLKAVKKHSGMYS